MKHLLSIALIALSAINASSQNLSNDKSIRKGTLENGLTYYLCYNYSLEDRADFYLVTGVGSLHESGEKAGITHLLEHLCFEGTGKFPGDGIETYCRNIGVHFGKDLNASTGRDRTIHEICNVPLVEQFVVDSCIQILHDWASDVRISQETLDQEREVILQERTQRLDHSRRLDSLSAEFLYGDSPYSNSIIGTPETLNSITVEDVTDFYRTWYRPDNQAVIIVGDFELNPVERKLQKIFGTIEKPSVPLDKEKIRVPDSNTTTIGIISDPETIGTEISFHWRQDTLSPEEQLTMEGQRKETMEFLVYRELNGRLDELFSLENLPYVQNRLQRSSYGGEQEDIILNTSMSTSVAKEAFRLIATEIERLARNGLTEENLKSIKASLTDSYEKAARTADHRSNGTIASDCWANFLYGTPYFSPASELKMIKNIFGTITAESLKKTAVECLRNRKPIIICAAPDSELDTVPSEKEFMDILDDVRKSELPPVVHEEIPNKLMDRPDSFDNLVTSEAYGLNQTTELRLSNGMTVVLWQTSNGSKSIYFDMFKIGGLSRISAEELPNFENTVQSVFFENSGVASYTASALKKMLKDKKVGAAPYVNSLSHGITAYSTQDYQEEMFQLINLYWTLPRFEQTALDKTVGILKPLAANNAKNPDSRISRLQSSVFYSDTSRLQFLDENTIEKIELESIESNYRALFDGARGAVAVIIGDFRWDSIRDMVNRYLGTIPSGNFSQVQDNGNGYADGKVYNQFSVKMETPMSKITHRIHMEVPEYSYETLVGLDFTEYILNKRLNDNIRKRQGGTYSVSVSSSLSAGPSPTARLTVTFECPANMVYFLSKLTKREVEMLATYGPTMEELEMAKLYLDKELQDSAITIDFWLDVLREYYLFDINNHSGYMFAMLQMNAEDIVEQMVKICSSPNYAEVIIHPSGK